MSQVLNVLTELKDRTFDRVGGAMPQERMNNINVGQNAGNGQLNVNKLDPEAIKSFFAKGDGLGTMVDTFAGDRQVS